MLKGANALVEFINPEKGLPSGSYDLWEERFGIHSYSTAAVIAGLRATINAAGVMGTEKNINAKEIRKWQETADRCEEALLTLWRPSLNRFVRSLNGNAYQFEDHEVDISLLGISVPFKIIPPSDDKMVTMAKTLEEQLTSPKIGGIKRYVHDQYIGGNPWVLCTLWLALYYIEIKEYSKAKSLLKWTIEHRTRLSLLPEQVNKDSGEPAWVIPLTWSHAMYIMTVIGLARAGKI